MLLSLFWATSASAASEPAQPIQVTTAESAPVSFSRMVIREDSSMGQIYELSPSFRINVLETLRAQGYNVKGAENLIFGQDDGAQADYLLGGELVDGRCTTSSMGWRECWARVDWQLFKVSTQTVVYQQQVEGSWAGYNETPIEGAIQGSLEGLLTYPAFPAQLAREGETPEYEELTLKECPAASLTLPKELDQAKSSVLLVKTPDGIGTGVTISPDGFVLTAAHVVRGHQEVSVKTSAGIQLQATVLRVDNAQDVALLSMPGSGYACTAPRSTPPTVGEELWAIGNPLGEELSFSVTKGLVSGLRELEDQSYVQTDAPLNPGYSGGPLLDQHGQLLGVISWKIAGASYEGLGFGVPLEAAQSSLNLAFGEHSQAIWGGSEVQPVSAGGEEVRRFTPNLPATVRAESSSSSSMNYDLPDLRVEEPKMGLRVSVLSAGALALGGTAAWYYATDETTPDTWRRMTALNTTGWVVTAIGTALVVRAITGREDQEETSTATAEP